MQPTYLFTGVTVCKSGMGPAVLNALQEYPLLGLRLAKQPHADVVMFDVGKSHDQAILEKITQTIEFTHPVTPISPKEKIAQTIELTHLVMPIVPEIGVFPQINLSLITNNPQKAKEIYTHWQNAA